MDHSREVLKSHSEIYEVYGVLVQGETQYLGPCCSNVEQQEITIKQLRYLLDIDLSRGKR